MRQSHTDDRCHRGESREKKVKRVSLAPMEDHRRRQKGKPVLQLKLTQAKNRRKNKMC